MRNVIHGKKFLEVGAGNLKLSKDLIKKFENGTLIDYAPGIIDIYNKLPNSEKLKLTIMVGDFLKQKFKNKYDCIVSCEVLEHVEEDDKFLAKMHKLLNINGQLIISVPAKDKYWTIHDDVVGHLRRYSKKQLIDILKKNGFKDIKIYSYGYPFINIFWLFRAAHGRKQASIKKDWSKKKQTQESGIGQIPSKYNFLGIFINKYTFFLPNLFSTIFDKFDFSEGYVAVAKK